MNTQQVFVKWMPWIHQYLIGTEISSVQVDKYPAAGARVYSINELNDIFDKILIFLEVFIVIFI